MSSLRRNPRRAALPLGIVRTYLMLLPLSAMLTFYLLLADSVTASSAEDLRHARYGLPFAWVEQDLSRYEPIAFPFTLGFGWQRAWHDPIVTHYDWFAFAADVLIVGIAVTAAFLALVPLIRRLARRATRKDVTLPG